MVTGIEKLRVLVVDDVTSARRIVVKVLGQLGVKAIAEARSGTEALEKLRADPCHLIVSDWQMPDVSGLELLRQIRADASLQHTPFIMLTSESNREMVREAVLAVVSDYIVKPVSLHTLSEKIRTVFSQQGEAAAPKL